MSKKKHLVIICGVYYPEPSPTGLCAQRFSQLLIDSYDIEIISLSMNGKSELIKTHDGMIIHTLAGGVMACEQRARGVGKKLLHQIGRIQQKTLALGNLNWFKNKIEHCLKEIEERREIDAIFSICSPFSAHIAAKEFKSIYPHIHWCAYTVDPYSTNNRIKPVGWDTARLADLERKTLMMADCLLLSEEVYKSRKDLFTKHTRCEPLPYILPEFNFPSIPASYSNDEEICCVYAGRFYDNIRNPELLLDTFCRLRDSRIKLHLYSKGCESTVDSYVYKSNHIQREKQVPNTEIMKIYNNADLLVTVSNTTSEFLPSKTFEYIATGKPIICFNCNQTDLAVLANYPLKYCVEEKPDIDSIEQFIVNSKGKTVDKATIEKEYARHLKRAVRVQLLQSMS